MNKVILIVVLAFCTLDVLGQSGPLPIVNWQEKFFQSSDLVLPKLFDAAIKYSAQIENLDAAKQIAVENQQLERKRILNGIAIGSTYSYGSIYNLADPTSTRPIGGFNPFNLPTQSLYNVGAQAGISLYTLLGRRHELQRQVFLVKQADANRKIQERVIRQSVITLYQDILLARAQLEISQESYQSANLRFKLAEKQFTNHAIQIDEMATVQETNVRARIALETARIKYETSFLLMEEIVGMKISDLINNK